MRRSLLLFNSGNRPTEDFARFLRDIQIPGDDLASIDQALQQRFFQKGPDGQPMERWELQKVEVACPPERFRRHLQLCGFAMETIPQEWEYFYAAWPGALLVRAVVRLQDLVRAWESGVRWRETVVFGGKRPLQTERETPDAAASLINLAGVDHIARSQSFQSLWVETELDLMRWLWVKAEMSEELRMTARFVDAPMKPPAAPGGQPVRPTTENTIQEWLGSNPTPGSILLSSGAPYGMAQDEAFWMLLGPHGHTVETFGHALPEGLSVEVIMREVAGCVNRIRRARDL